MRAFEIRFLGISAGCGVNYDITMMSSQCICIYDYEPFSQTILHSVHSEYNDIKFIMSK